MTRSVVSLFSGVGGFDYGFEQAGYRTAFQCEIDERCRSVLRRQFPDVPQWGDITTLTGEHIVSTLAANGQTPDVIIWGSPCQDLSVAGNGAGLAGARSGLYYEGIRIINEIRKGTNNEYPRISVWENVAGALSSNNGADFGRVIDTLAEAGAVVIEWRLLAAHFFGIPQRRRRVFVIAVFDSAAAERCTEPLLPIAEVLHRDTAQSRSQKHRTAATTESSTGSESSTVIGFSHTQGLSPQASSVAFPTLRREGGGHAVLMRDLNEQPVLRRLMPIECERLMGWADDWTRYGHTGEELADTHRYKMCGNGVVSPVARWIAEQITRVL